MAPRHVWSLLGMAGLLSLALNGTAKADSWRDSKSFTVSRDNAAAVTGADGRIYLVGGLHRFIHAGSYLDSVEIWDPFSLQWTAGSPMPTARAFMGATLGPDGSIYVIGGNLGGTGGPVSNVDAYDPAIDTWTPGPPLEIPRTKCAAATGPDGKIYVFGGAAIPEVLDLSVGAWRPLSPMPTPRSALAAVTGPDGLIYTVGGSDGTAWRNIVEVYDPNTDTWTTGPALPSAYTEMSGTTLADGSIVVAGSDFDLFGHATTFVYVLDPNTLAWHRLPDVPRGVRGQATATAGDGRLYTLGGYTQGRDRFQSFASAQAYTPSGWYPGTGDTIARYGLAVAADYNSLIYAIGGYDGSMKLDTVRAYDPAADAWSDRPPLLHARDGLAAASNGRKDTIYAVGGADANGPIASVEKFDRTTWTEVAPMHVARDGLCVVYAGPSPGALYALGGHTADDLNLNTVERYDLVANQWVVIRPLETARSQAAAAVWQGGIVVAGGRGVDGNVLASVEMYALDGEPSALPSLQTPRGGLALVATADGTLYAIGGYDANYVPLDSIEILKPGGVGWFTGLPMDEPLFWHAAIGSPTGSEAVAVVIGGANGDWAAEPNVRVFVP